MKKRTLIVVLVVSLLLMGVLTTNMYTTNRELKKEIERGYETLGRDTKDLIENVKKVDWTIEVEENMHLLEGFPQQLFNKEIDFYFLENDASKLSVLFYDIKKAQEDLLKYGELTDEQHTQYVENLRTLNLIMHDFQEEFGRSELNWYKGFTKEDSVVDAIIEKRMSKE